MAAALKSRPILPHEGSFFLMLRDQVSVGDIKNGRYRLYSRKKNPKTGKRRNLGTFSSRSAAEKHERAVQYFKHGG